MKVVSSLIVFLLLTVSAQAQSLDLSYVVAFQEHGFKTHDFKTDLDCKPELGFNVDSQLVRADLERTLSLKGINITRNSDKLLRLYITHKDCGSVGQIDKMITPFGTSEDSFANAELRIITELMNKNTGQIISMREFVAASLIKRKTFGFIRFYLQYDIEDVYFSDLWTSLLKEIVQGVEKDL